MDNKSLYDYDSSYFFPETYVLNYTSMRYTKEELKFLNNEDNNPYQIWISKPAASSRGKGIELFNTTEIKQIYQKNKTQSILSFDPIDQGTYSSNSASYVV